MVEISLFISVEAVVNSGQIYPILLGSMEIGNATFIKKDEIEKFSFQVDINNVEDFIFKPTLDQDSKELLELTANGIKLK